MAVRSFQPHGPYDWRGAQTQALLTTIWYPAAASAIERPIEIPGLSDIFILASAARDAEFAYSLARFPLIVLSHGTGGSALSMAWFGTALARHGYVVAAVNHPGNNAAEPYTIEGFSFWWQRARDLSVVIDAMLADPEFGSHLDPHRIGAAGFSLGGYTMIEIAGGTTDPQALTAFCASPRADSLCKSPPEFPTLAADFNRLSRADAGFQAALRRGRDSYRDPRVRAVFAMAPALGPAFHPESLTGISIPVRIVAGASDAIVPIATSAKFFAANIRHAQLTIFPGNVAHYVFLDTCTEAGRKSQPVLCADGSGVERTAIHATTISLAVDFFSEKLK